MVGHKFTSFLVTFEDYIKTRSSANAEKHCQLKSCKMLHCSTDCIWKGLQQVNDLQGHSRSLPLLPFDRPYTTSYWSCIVSISASCTVFEILSLICQKIKTTRDLDHAHLGTVCHHGTSTSGANPCSKFDNTVFSHSREIYEGYILKWITRPWSRPFQGRSVVRRLTLDIRNLQAHKIWRR